MTPLYLVAGPTYGSSMGVVMSCVIILCASTLNMIWTYFVAAGVLHKYVEKVLNYLNYGFPQIKGQEHVQMILIMRVTPGIPFVVQNYLLGLAKVRFGAYLPISIVVQGGYLVGFVVTSGAIYDGDIGLVIGGICALVAAVIFTNLLRRRLLP